MKQKKSKRRVTPPQDEDHVLVVRDSRDASRDYQLPRKKALKLYDEGKLVRMQVYGNRWDFAEPRTS